jgi:hypothetical protein
MKEHGGSVSEVCSQLVFPAEFAGIEVSYLVDFFIPEELEVFFI